MSLTACALVDLDRASRDGTGHAPALAVGGGLVDDGRARAPQFLHRVARLGHLDHGVGGEEAENEVVAHLRELGGARDGQHGHAVFGGDGEHGQHLGAEDGPHGGRRTTGCQRPLERRDRLFGRGRSVRDLVADLDASGRALQGEEGAVALARPLEREEAGDRHQDGDARLLGHRDGRREGGGGGETGRKCET